VDENDTAQATEITTLEILKDIINEHQYVTVKGKVISMRILQ